MLYGRATTSEACRRAKSVGWIELSWGCGEKRTKAGRRVVTRWKGFGEREARPRAPTAPGGAARGRRAAPGVHARCDGERSPPRARQPRFEGIHFRPPTPRPPRSPPRPPPAAPSRFSTPLRHPASGTRPGRLARPPMDPETAKSAIAGIALRDPAVATHACDADATPSPAPSTPVGAFSVLFGSVLWWGRGARPPGRAESGPHARRVSRGDCATIVATLNRRSSLCAALSRTTRAPRRLESPPRMHRGPCGARRAPVRRG